MKKEYIVKKMNNPDFSTNEHLNKHILFCISPNETRNFPMATTIGKILPLGKSLRVKGFTVSLSSPEDKEKSTHSILGRKYFGNTPYGSDPLPEKDSSFYKEFVYYEFMEKLNLKEMKKTISQGIEKIVIKEEN